jgi:predicted AlkP superfamily pyrophosphatase or phosphodiesterase
MRFIRKLFTGLIVLFTAGSLLAAGKASHVLVVVWDGMRPDFVTPETTPTLWKLAQEGVTFRHHHPVYISTTEVNGTALSTGVYPEESGVIGNDEYRPELNPLGKTMTADPRAVRKADSLPNGHFLAVPTLAEILQAHGLHTAVAGAKTVALLPDRSSRSRDALGIDLAAGAVLPESFGDKLTTLLGGFPAAGSDTAARNLWTTKALIGPLWEQQVPPFSVLWLSEPDASQHATGPGSAASLAAIRSSDQNLARVLAMLREKHLDEQTDVIVVSDHAFSTIIRAIDVAAVLGTNGFSAVYQFTSLGPRVGDILVVNNGGSVFFYVVGHDPGLIGRLVRFLQAQPYCGVVLAKAPIEGTFSLETVKLNSPAAPDVVMSMRWNQERSTNGTPGMLYCGSTEYGPGQGMHGSLSAFDMHNTCVATGPNFAKGVSDELPTGNVDIAPTVLWILGIEPQHKMSGRVLSEVLRDSGTPAPKPETHHLEATYRAKEFTWRQFLDYTEVNGVRYLDSGNGEQLPLLKTSRK